MKKILIIGMVFLYNVASSQELFLMTDPASNVPANSVSVNVLQSLFKSEESSASIYKMMPEVTYGANKNLMFRASAFLSNADANFSTNGASFFSKYRFYSSDDLNSHFRLATFGRISFNNAQVHHEEIEIMGNNSGFEAGFVATQLINKLAISSTISLEKAFSNLGDRSFPTDFGDDATNYSLSLGKLMYPKKYTSFKQTNINLMVELVGQTINSNGRSYLDVVPVIQFIFHSQARLDLGYRHQLVSSMSREATNGIYFNLYYTFFNLKNK